MSHFDQIVQSKYHVVRRVQEAHDQCFGMLHYRHFLEEEVQLTHYTLYQRIIYDLGRCTFHDLEHRFLVGTVNQSLVYIGK